MIPRTHQAAYTPKWQEELKNLITCPKALFTALDLPLDQLPSAYQGDQLFALRVTRPFLQRMKKGDLRDPLLMQVLPIREESQSPNDYTEDPLAEHQHNPTQGVIHKYHGRVLLITAAQCAINCRYCFRRSFDYTSNSPSRGEWQQSLSYIREDNSINEVIFSGGDPLVLGDKQIDWILSEIEAIPHITRVRIHSRLPIVIPARITETLLTRLNHSRLNAVMVVHCNHPNEIDAEVQAALMRFKKAGITLLNQSVLLAGINDNSNTLIELSERLFDAGALPYYLHLMDKAKGTAHFDLPEEQAVAIHQQMQAHLPGFLVPKLVREIPHRPNKTCIF